MKAENSKPRLRILVGLNACRSDLSALELAAGLAARKGGELLALFVEDINLSHVAELPFVKEVDRYFGTERELDHPRIARTQRASLSKIQAVIDRLTERLQLKASVKILRGHFVQTVLSSAGEIDVLILSRKTEAWTARPRPSHGIFVAGRRRTQASEEPVWAVFDGSEESRKALLAAAEIAAAEPCPLYVAAPARSQWELEHLRQQLTSSLPPDVGLMWFLVDPLEVNTLLRQLRHSGCRLLVVKRSDGELSKEIAEAAECPVLLI